MIKIHQMEISGQFNKTKKIPIRMTLCKPDGFILSMGYPSVQWLSEP